MQLPLTNVINISVSAAQTGVGQYNTSNIGLFSREAYAPATFGSLGYKIYLDPSEVATDFGTSSNTYAMALGIFSQQPNILAGGGYLVIIPYDLSVQALSFAVTPTTGAYTLKYNGNSTASIAYNAIASVVQSDLQAVMGLSSVTVTGSYTAGFVITMTGVTTPILPITVGTNTTLQTIILGSTETLDVAIARTENLVQYFGVMSAEVQIQSVMLAVAAVIQTLNKIAFFVSNQVADFQPGGMLDLLRSGTFTQSRGLFYGGTIPQALVMMASYAAVGLSVNFNGSNTTITMHLKDLSGVQPDPVMTQTYLTQCQTAGVDVYISLQGAAKVFTSGSNQFFDNVYNLQWFVGSLQVAGFNYLAQTNTKIPQTENGMTGLKNAYRQVCEQAVTNQYSAPGNWTSPTTFGNQADLLLNVAQRGYYIYSLPVAQQLPSVRATRAAPLVQIALQAAGAIHSSSVIVNVNA